MVYILRTLPVLKLYRITLLTNNKTAALLLRSPRQQSGQEYICEIYKLIRRLQKNRNRITICWIPINENNKLLDLAKEQARTAFQEDPIPYTQLSRMKSTILNIVQFQQDISKVLPEKIGKYIKKVDAALPGKHTRQLYNRLLWKKASVLAQLWTGIARLNVYLYRINVAQTDQYIYRQARETVKYFLFRYQKWTAHRTEMLQYINIYRRNIFFFLGRKLPSDNQNWTPNLEAVQAYIQFAIATGRLDATTM